MLLDDMSSTGIFATSLRWEMLGTLLNFSELLTHEDNNMELKKKSTCESILQTVRAKFYKGPKKKNSFIIWPHISFHKVSQSNYLGHLVLLFWYSMEPLFSPANFCYIIKYAIILVRFKRELLAWFVTKTACVNYIPVKKKLNSLNTAGNLYLWLVGIKACQI